MRKEYLPCDSCFRIFKSKECFDNHLILGKSKIFSAKTSVCGNLVACQTCGRDLIALIAKNGVSTGKNAYTKHPQDHYCYHSKCVSCKQQVKLDTRFCFLHPLSLCNPKFRVLIDKRGEYCFFDVEAMKVWVEQKKRHINFLFLILLLFSLKMERREILWERTV